MRDVLLSWRRDVSPDGTSQRSQRQWISGCFKGCYFGGEGPSQEVLDSCSLTVLSHTLKADLCVIPLPFPCQITSGYMLETLAGVCGEEVLCETFLRENKSLFTPDWGPEDDTPKVKLGKAMHIISGIWMRGYL